MRRQGESLFLGAGAAISYGCRAEGKVNLISCLSAVPAGCRRPRQHELRVAPRPHAADARRTIRPARLRTTVAPGLEAMRRAVRLPQSGGPL